MHAKLWEVRLLPRERLGRAVGGAPAPMGVCRPSCGGALAAMGHHAGQSHLLYVMHCCCVAQPGNCVTSKTLCGASVHLRFATLPAPASAEQRTSMQTELGEMRLLLRAATRDTEDRIERLTAERDSQRAAASASIADLER